MATIDIRLLQPPDQALVRQMLIDEWGSDRMVSRGRLHHVADLPGFMAYFDSTPTGLLTYHVEQSACEIVTIHSTQPGRGIGRMLIEAVKAEGVRQGCQRLWLITTNDNTPALRFYQMAGFHIAAIHTDALEESRRLKPDIPLTGLDGISLRDEIELVMALSTDTT